MSRRIRVVLTLTVDNKDVSKKSKCFSDKALLEMPELMYEIEKFLGKIGYDPWYPKKQSAKRTSRTPKF